MTHLQIQVNLHLPTWLIRKKDSSLAKRDAMRKLTRRSGQGDRRQTRSQTVCGEKEEKEQEKEEMRYEVRKTDHIDYDLSFASIDTHVCHESLQPDLDDQAQNIVDHNTCSIVTYVFVSQESTMGPCTLPPETASLDDEDNISDGYEDDSKDKINYSTFDNRSRKCVNNGKRLCNSDAQLLCSKCSRFYICSFCHISNIYKDHEQFLVNR